jgi:hypothetical protein
MNKGGEGQKTVMITIHFGNQPEKREIRPDQGVTGSGPFYVYVHRDNTGRIFYVGKGTGQRAWKGDRHPVWDRYVQERSGGTHTVQIVSYHQTSDEAEHEEQKLISQYGEQLVNWINPGRQFDYPALKRFHELRNANRILLDEAKRIESSDRNHGYRRRQSRSRLDA